MCVSKRCTIIDFRELSRRPCVLGSPCGAGPTCKERKVLKSVLPGTARPVACAPHRHILRPGAGRRYRKHLFTIHFARARQRTLKISSLITSERSHGWRRGPGCHFGDPFFLPVGPPVTFFCVVSSCFTISPFFSVRVWGLF